LRGSQRKGDQADDNGEQDDGDAEIMEEEVIDPDQHIGHGGENYGIPKNGHN
jgi:hypothetical protein